MNTKDQIIKMTIPLPADFNENEVKGYKENMTRMAAYYIKEVIRDRGAKKAENVRKGVRYE